MLAPLTAAGRIEGTGLVWFDEPSSVSLVRERVVLSTALAEAVSVVLLAGVLALPST